MDGHDFFYPCKPSTWEFCEDNTLNGPLPTFMYQQLDWRVCLVTTTLANFGTQHGSVSSAVYRSRIRAETIKKGDWILKVRYLRAENYRYRALRNWQCLFCSRIARAAIQLHDVQLHSISFHSQMKQVYLLNYRDGYSHANNSDALSERTCPKLCDKCSKQKTPET
jgi:hypothetical protein